MIKINCHWYSYDEVKEALQNKGYAIVLDEHEPDKRGNVKVQWLAIKDGFSKNLESAALDEFHKKLPLI